jgi:hypothetical protein
MKIILLCSIFLTNILFANYAFTGDNSGKIDMHGGKSDMLSNNKNSLSGSKLNNLGNIGINKPLAPIAPKTLIKEEIKKEEIKEITK